MNETQGLDRPPLRIGLFGGTFDPVHIGHLAVAREALRQLQLDKVIFIPSGIPPSTQKSRPKALGGDRVRMLTAALHDEPGFEVSDFEIARDEVSYTIGTVRHMASNNPAGTIFFFLLGDDCAAKLPHWVGIGEMRSKTHFVAVNRSETPPPMEAWISRMQMPPIAISSTEIRRRIAEGSGIEDFVPPAVCHLIRERGLYGMKTTEDVL